MTDDEAGAADASRPLAIELDSDIQSAAEDDFGGQRAPSLAVEGDLDPLPRPGPERANP